MARSYGWTCESRVGGQKVQNCERTLQEFVKQDVYSSDARLELLLKVLEWNRTCSNYQSSRKLTYVPAWEKSIKAILPWSKLVIEQAIANNALNEPQIRYQPLVVLFRPICVPTKKVGRPGLLR